MAFLLHARLIGSTLLLVSTFSAHGQTSESTVPAPTTPSFLLGFRAGYSNYTMAGTEADLHTQPHTGEEVKPVQWFTVGVAVRKHLYKPLWVQAELNYLRAGGKFTRSYFIGKTDYTIDCVQIPVLLSLHMPASSSFSLHPQVGVALSSIVGGVKLDQSSFATGTKFDNPSFTVGVVYGLELDWQRGRHAYLFNARFSNDLTNFFQREYSNTNYNLHSSGFSLTTGMLFGL